MDVKLGGCYYHEGKAAVAICAKCGVGICRECAVKEDGGRILCVSCGNENLKMEHKKYRQMLKAQGGRFKSGKDFIAPGIIGLLIILALVAIAWFTDRESILRNINQINRCNDIYEIFGLILAGICGAYILFSIPFAIILMNDIFAPKYDTTYNIFSKWYFKFCVALFLGWIVFTFYLVRFIILKIRERKTKD